MGMFFGIFSIPHNIVIMNLNNIMVISCLNNSFCREKNNLVLSCGMVVVCKVIVKIIGLTYTYLHIKKQLRFQTMILLWRT